MDGPPCAALKSNLPLQIGHAPVRFALPTNEQQVQMLVKELLALSPDVVVAPGTAPTAAFRRESRNVPIVFIGVGDPVAWASSSTWRGRAAILRPDHV